MRRPILNKRVPEPDLKYSSSLLSRMINNVMYAGKKTIAMKVVYGALAIAEKQLSKPGLEIFEKAVENAAPNVELKSRRVGGANYQVPIEIRPDRRIALALRWLIDSARAGKGKAMEQKLSEELVNAYNNTGNAVKKKMDMHRMAEANRAFAHLAWGNK